MKNLLTLNNLLPLWRNYLFSPLEMVFGNQQQTTQRLKRFINCKGCILHYSVTYSNTIFFYSVKYILFNLSFEGNSQINKLILNITQYYSILLAKLMYINITILENSM